MLAVGCLVSIILILSLHQGQPMPSWPELISVNSLVAIFTAVFKASLIMPVAEGGHIPRYVPCHVCLDTFTDGALGISLGLGQLKWEWFSRPRSLADMVLFDDASRGLGGL